MLWRSKFLELRRDASFASMTIGVYWRVKSVKLAAIVVFVVLLLEVQNKGLTLMAELSRLRLKLVPVGRNMQIDRLELIRERLLSLYLMFYLL